MIALDVRNHFRETHQAFPLDATLYLLFQFIEFLEDGYLFQVALQVFVLVDLQHELSTWILTLLNVENATLGRILFVTVDNQVLMEITGDRVFFLFIRHAIIGIRNCLQPIFYNISILIVGV